MIDFVDITKKQDILNASYKQIPCLSCRETYSEENKVYLITFKNHKDNQFIPLCRRCTESLLLAIDLETNENIIEVD